MKEPSHFSRIGLSPLADRHLTIINDCKDVVRAGVDLCDVVWRSCLLSLSYSQGPPTWPLGQNISLAPPVLPSTHRSPTPSWPAIIVQHSMYTSTEQYWRHFFKFYQSRMGGLKYFLPPTTNIGDNQKPYKLLDSQNHQNIHFDTKL